METTGVALLQAIKNPRIDADVFIVRLLKLFVLIASEAASAEVLIHWKEPVPATA